MKKILEKIWSITKKVICSIGFFLAAVYTVLFIKDKNKYDINNEDKIKEDKENEIKKTDAADIIDNSPNKDDIQQSIEHIQEDFRQRIRDRFNKTL